MNVIKVRRLYEIKRLKKDLEAEEEQLIKEFKEEMLSKNVKETVVGDFRLQLQCQDRSTFDRSIVAFFRERGYQDLIIETYDNEKFKQLMKQGVFDEKELEQYRLEKLVYYLYIKPL